MTSTGRCCCSATARPELARSRPAWGGRGRDSETLWLEALSSSDAARMLDELVPAELPASLREVVIQRAEGNPFFVEELVRTLIDQGVLERRNGGWTVHELADDLDVPDTVQAVLAARIDLLEPAEKAALQAAAVIGRTFWSGPVYELLEGVEPDLRLLEERDFIRHRRAPRSWASASSRSSTRSPARLRTKACRRRGARVSTRASRRGSSGPEKDGTSMRLCWPTTTPRRCDPRMPTLPGPSEDEELARLRERAVSWLRRAAELAVGRYEIEDALALLHRAVELETSRQAQVEIWGTIAHANALLLRPRRVLVGDAAGDRARGRGSARWRTSMPSCAFQTIVRAGMWGVAPPAELVEGWIERALELAGPRARRGRRPSSPAATPTTTSPASWPARRAGSPNAWATRSSARTATTCAG